jgi:phosphoribosylanthranilate isomerase
VVKVKICGITNAEDAILACESGADLLGFVFVADTPRAVDGKIVKKIVERIHERFGDRVALVGLFKDEDPGVVERTLEECGLDHVQLHGDESEEYCAQLKARLPGIKIIKVFKIRHGIMPIAGKLPADYESADIILFDTYHPSAAGGSGTRFEIDTLKNDMAGLKKPFFVAGGLKAVNVADVVFEVKPHGVDVSSGVESSPGRKDAKILKEFIENAKKR